MPILNRRNISPGEPHDTETVLCSSGRGRWSRASNGTSPPAYFIKEEALPSGGIWGDTTGIDSSLRTFYPFFKKECHACLQEQAYHIVPRRFNLAVRVNHHTPSREEFRQHLRRLAVSAVQVLIEQVMREELEQCIGASWGECTPTRHGYRHGSSTRDLVTRTGRMEALKV